MKSPDIRPNYTYTKPDKSKSLYGPAAVLGAAVLGAAYLMSGGVGGKSVDNKPSYTPSALVSHDPATPTPSEAAGSASPSEAAESASPSPEPRGDKYSKPGHFDSGTFAAVKAGDFVVGDIQAANAGTGQTSADINKYVRLYDTDGHTAPGVKDTGKTGLLTHFDQDAEVYFPYGGDLVTDVKNPDFWAAKQIQDMVNGGCDNGCSQGVGIFDQATQQWKPVEWTGMDTTMTQELKLAKDVLAEDNAANPNSGESLNPCATPTPEPSSCGCAVATGCPHQGDNPLPIGSVLKVEPGEIAIVQADAQIDGVNRFDSKDSTGAIDVLNDGKAHTIKLTQGGGDVIIYCPNTPISEVEAKYQSVLQALLNTRRTLDSKSLNQLPNI